nr:MAG: methylmalonyl Co-A mutase-associated GTPase MeaB [Bacteroidota bacterium]
MHKLPGLTSSASTNKLLEGIIAGNRSALARAITLIESTRDEDNNERDALLQAILPHTGKAMRVGITGAPGVGKSTLIEALGMHLVSEGKKVAVLTIDPSSNVSKGSILADKTRMTSLSRHENAFIRPTASGGGTGGVAAHTREALLLCEAAGYDIVIVETVGVGQSEVAVKNMVDFFLLLMLPGSGDELQGMKKGIVEMADALVITKADGDNVARAARAQADFSHALHLLPPPASWWKPRVLTCSSVTGDGIAEIAAMMDDFDSRARESGYRESNRAEQKIHWLNETFELLIRNDIARRDLQATRSQLEEMVRNDKIPVSKAARELLAAYHRSLTA